jgi:hypothetical protein
MMFSKPAVVVGVAAGLLTAGGSLAYPSQIYPVYCKEICSAFPSWVSILLGALGILLLFDSALSLVGPRRAFYGETIVSGLIALVLVSVEAFRTVDASFLLAALVLSVATVVLSLLAARTRAGLSEQSNPMNLPVFG